MNTDRVELRGIRAVGTIGVLPEEQRRSQPFEIDLTIDVDVHDAGRTDDLHDTINYAIPITVATKVVNEERHLLLERVATRIAEEVLHLPRVEGVEVLVRKLRPPVPEDVSSTAVRIYRRRPDLVEPLRKITTAYVAIGSNLGDRRQHLRQGIVGLHSAAEVTAVSNVYETEPVGGPDNQGPYLNMVVELETRLDPFQLLSLCRRVEAASGRERHVRWGARTLDLDVLLYDDLEIRSEELTIPHPRMFERRFVLAPLSEIAPSRVPKDWHDRLAPGGITVVQPLDIDLASPPRRLED